MRSNFDRLGPKYNSETRIAVDRQLTMDSHQMSEQRSKREKWRTKEEGTLIGRTNKPGKTEAHLRGKAYTGLALEGNDNKGYGLQSR